MAFEAVGTGAGLKTGPYRAVKIGSYRAVKIGSYRAVKIGSYRAGLKTGRLYRLMGRCCVVVINAHSVISASAPSLNANSRNVGGEPRRK